MNVFEDLVVELKEENLLEETFIDLPEHSRYGELADDDVLASTEIHSPDESVPEQSFAPVEAYDLQTDRHYNYVEPELTPMSAAIERNAPANISIPAPGPVPVAGDESVGNADLKLQGNEEIVEIRKPNSQREFFKKRAANEMSSLKMVDAVLSAVEREHLKVIPRTYDDLDAKKALHAFLQVAENVSGDEHKEAEFKLLNETELWCSALGERDKNISVGHLRVYCENCRPMLSSQAMLAMARFYRNLPHSETVRAKFDFIVTRLFSKPTENTRRHLLFTRQEMYGHIKTLYADWSSIPLYAADENDSNILLTALSFEELAGEAESATAFDELIRSDFFGRLRLFKESIAELFFAPTVTAAAVECNVRIGNRYVELINGERLKVDVDSIHLRYGELDDQMVSEAAGRSLSLLEVLREKSPAPVVEAKPQPVEYHANTAVHEEAGHSRPEIPPVVKKTAEPRSIGDLLKPNLRSVNRLFVAGAALLIAASIGIYVWANYFAEAKVSTVGVKTLSFQGTDLNDLVKLARLSGDTLYIIAQPTFDGMGKDKQTDIMQRFLQAGKDKGWDKVNIMNGEGRTVGFASSTRSEIYPQ